MYNSALDPVNTSAPLTNLNVYIIYFFLGPCASAQNVKKWESEMQTLRNNNAMLTTALEESTQHVAEWKRQLQKYKEDCDSLKKKVRWLDE